MVVLTRDSRVEQLVEREDVLFRWNVDVALVREGKVILSTE